MITTKSLKASKVDVKENLDILFALDTKVAKAGSHLFVLETKEKFLDFLTKEHKSETWIWKDYSHGNLIGYLSLVDKPSEDAMEVLSIAIDPEFQNKGYGKQMMTFAEELAVKNRRNKIMLVTNTKNLPAISFYKGLGYNIVKEMPNYYGDGETRYLFEKILVNEL